jgi:hypothetical protein
MKFIKLSATCAACVLLMTACGGDIDNASTVVQGFWSGSVTGAPDTATSVNTVIVPGETAWMVFANGTTATGLAKIPVTAVSVSGTEANASGNGFYYKLGAGTRQEMTLAGKATTSNVFTGNSKLGTATAFSLSLTGDAAYKTASQASSLVATWKGAAGGSTVTFTWTVNSTGVVSGSSSAGCTYGGSIKPNAAGVAVLDVAVTESCQSVNKTFSGIATLNPAKTVLNIAYTTAADVEGNLLQLTKQ